MKQRVGADASDVDAVRSAIAALEDATVDGVWVVEIVWYVAQLAAV